MLFRSMAVIKIRDFQDTAAIVVPSRTILRDVNQNPYLFVLEGDKAIKKSIETGMSSDGYTQITKGIKADVKIIDKGSRGIKDKEIVAIK